MIWKERHGAKDDGNPLLSCWCRFFVARRMAKPTTTTTTTTYTVNRASNNQIITSNNRATLARQHWTTSEKTPGEQKTLLCIFRILHAYTIIYLKYRVYCSGTQFPRPEGEFWGKFVRDEKSQSTQPDISATTTDSVCIGIYFNCVRYSHWLGGVQGCDQVKWTWAAVLQLLEVPSRSTFERQP